MSPEMWEAYSAGKGMIGDPFKSDVYSLGVLLVRVVSLDPLDFLQDQRLSLHSRHLKLLGVLKALSDKQSYSEFILSEIAAMIQFDN